jgi:hypothetical protein
MNSTTTEPEEVIEKKDIIDKQLGMYFILLVVKTKIE